MAVLFPQESFHNLTIAKILKKKRTATCIPVFYLIEKIIIVVYVSKMVGLLYVRIQNYKDLNI